MTDSHPQELSPIQKLKKLLPFDKRSREADQASTELTVALNSFDANLDDLLGRVRKLAEGVSSHSGELPPGFAEAVSELDARGSAVENDLSKMGDHAEKLTTHPDEPHKATITSGHIVSAPTSAPQTRPGGVKGFLARRRPQRP